METLARRDAVPVGGRPGRWITVVAGLIGLAVLVPTVAWIIEERARAERCDALFAHIDGLETARWMDGVTEQDPTWIGVLLSYSEIDGPTRDAVAADAEGFERMLAALPTELKQRAEQIHRDQILRGVSPDILDWRPAANARLLAAHVAEECGIAP
jgi:hypothetical protein